MLLSLSTFFFWYSLHLIFLMLLATLLQTPLHGLDGLLEVVDVAVADTSSHLLHHILLVCSARHSDSQLKRDGVHLAAYHHRANQFANVVDAHQIVL